MSSISAKLKINTKSLTKAELVGVDDNMIFVMLMKHFFESQVRSINVNSSLKPLGSEVTIEQDNTSAIQLERNGWKSSSKRTNHINVQYFYITDRLKLGMSAELSTRQLEMWKVIILLKHFKEKHFTLTAKPSWGWMGSTSLCFTRSIKIRTGEIVSISPPIHNK